MNAEEKNRLLLEHPEYASLIHYVRGDRNRQGFWRVKPYCYKNPSPRQLEHRRDFAKVAHKQYGKKGFVNNTPVVPYNIGKALKFKRQMGMAPREVEQRIKLNRLAIAQGIRLRIQIPKIILKV